MHFAETDVHVLGSKENVIDVCDAEILQQHGVKNYDENLDELWILQ